MLEWLNKITALVAQASDPISGGAGWVGAGLLGMVLAWLLLKHLPDKDRQTREQQERWAQFTAEKDGQFLERLNNKDLQIDRLMEGRNLVVRELTTDFAEQLRESRKEFKDALNEILQQHDRQVTELSVAIKQEFERMYGVRQLGQKGKPPHEPRKDT